MVSLAARRRPTTNTERDLEARIQELEDVRAIIDLEADYARAADTVDPDGYGNVFTEDGVIELGDRGEQPTQRVSGRAAISDFCRNVIAKSYKFGMHSLHNAQIVVDGDTATGNLYFEATTHSATDKIGWSSGSYQDEYVRTPEGWKISKKVISFAFRR
ncbi:MAG: nuclear transport factor 2 family protein [Dehalococcoidia bacterium]